VAAVIVVCASLLGCEPGEQEIRLAAQDFRFIPSTIRIRADRPVRLILVNEGREPHEFVSRLLPEPGSLHVLPGRSATVVLQALPGTYPFKCRVRGHAGMEGTMIVES
jgi:uncharacterized cupredoxin-like copper-binding protein